LKGAFVRRQAGVVIVLFHGLLPCAEWYDAPGARATICKPVPDCLGFGSDENGFRAARLFFGPVSARWELCSCLSNHPRRTARSRGASRKTGEAIPAVGLGTWQVFDVASDAKEKAQAQETLKVFAELGGRVIDSSPMYGSSES